MAKEIKQIEPEQQEVTLTPIMLINQALTNNVSIEQLAQLMDLQERWEKKEAKKTFMVALAAFQAEMPVLKKNKTAKITSKTGGSYSYTYAELGYITSIITPLLSKHGLSYRWDFQEVGDKLKVTCNVTHIDGHTECTSMEAGRDNSGSKNDIQQKGSTMTYLQRYTLIGALGLSTANEDIDGQGTQENESLKAAKEAIEKATTKEEFEMIWGTYPELQGDIEFRKHLLYYQKMSLKSQPHE